MNRSTKKITINSIIILVLVIGFGWVCSRFIHMGSVAYTDNAQVRRHIVPVNSRVQGFIKKICFDEFQQVHRGDTLVIIEDAEYRLRLAQAEANCLNSQAGKDAMGTSISTTSNNLSVSDASIEEVRIRMLNAEKDYKRYEALLAREAVTQQQFDAMRTNYEALKANYEMLIRQKQSTALIRQEQTQRLDQNQAAIDVAQAALDLARLNLSYTVITAPCDGITSRKAIQEGQLVQPGQALLSVVDDNEVWVIANYRETQTANITEGMEATITVDAIPGVTYKGYVQALSQATGAQYAIVPQDNSAGNFVKVEQRVPVKIAFSKENKSEDMRKLRAGLNVECEVKF